MRCEQDKDSGNEVVYDKNGGGEKILYVVVNKKNAQVIVFV